MVFFEFLHAKCLQDATFSKVFGIYTLKYSSDLDAVFGEEGVQFLTAEVL